MSGVGAGDGEGVVGVLDDKLQCTQLGDNLFDLGEVDEEGAVATDHHGVVLQRCLRLLGGGAEHVAAHVAIAQMIHFHVVAHRFDIEEVGNREGDALAGAASEGDCEIA